MALKLFGFVSLCLIGMNSLANIEPITLESENTLYIVDGDSVSMQMRIQGIDTPEIGQKCQKTKNSKLIRCGYLAKDYLRQLLQNLPGQLIIEPMGVDRYDRILVRIYKGEVDVGRLMVEEGMAFSYKTNYQREQDNARIEKIGFWGFFKPPINPYKWRKENRQ